MTIKRGNIQPSKKPEKAEKTKATDKKTKGAKKSPSSVGKKTTPKEKRPDGLSDRQGNFVDEYLIDFNGTRAAIAAGYSKETAESQASRLLRNDKVKEAVAKGREAKSIRNRITADEVMQEIARIAFADLRDVTEWGTSRGRSGMVLKNSDEISDDAAAAIQEIKIKRSFRPGPEDMPPVEVEETAVKLHDKLGALKTLAKHLGLTPEKVEHTGKDGGPIEVREELDLSGLSPKELALYARIKEKNPLD